MEGSTSKPPSTGTASSAGSENYSTPSPNLGTRNELPELPTHSRHAQSRKKSSTACTACKKRKSKCTGEVPCARCVQRGTEAECVIDSTTDQRRKGASGRRLEELVADRLTLDGIVQIIRSGDEAETRRLNEHIRSNLSRAELAMFVENSVGQGGQRRSSIATASTSPSITSQSEIQPGRPAISQGDRTRIPELLNYEDPEENP